MANNSYSVANGGEVNALWRGGLRERQFRNGMERSGSLSSAVKFALQVLLVPGRDTACEDYDGHTIPPVYLS